MSREIYIYIYNIYFYLLQDIKSALVFCFLLFWSIFSQICRMIRGLFIILLKVMLKSLQSMHMSRSTEVRMYRRKDNSAHKQRGSKCTRDQWKGERSTKLHGKLGKKSNSQEVWNFIKHRRSENFLYRLGYWKNLKKGTLRIYKGWGYTCITIEDIKREIWN